jgi:tRNA-dihydrouridine synthase B
MNENFENSSLKIYMAPLQGFTDYAFRNSFVSVFGAPDAAFTPYLISHKPNSRTYRDVLPERNSGLHIIPQILGNNTTEILIVLNELQKMGYKEVNLNLGCPYPMVTKKQMGAGLLVLPNKIDEILKVLFSESDLKISVKMRLGLANNDDWKELVPVLNSYPLSEVIIHGRTATQMYKGDVDTESFIEFSEQINHPVCFNGNIFTLEQYQFLANKLTWINRWMLGRGLIANPLLIQEIRTGQKAGEKEIEHALELLHNKLLQINSARLNGPSHILYKMKPYWEYFALSFTGREKKLKKIKKSVTLEKYQSAVNEVFSD